VAGLILPGVLLALAVWVWQQDRDPLLYLIPPALAFPPLLAYGGRALGWPTAWLSTKVALALCLTLWATFRLAKGDYRWNRLAGSWFIVPWILLVLSSVAWVVLGPLGGDVAAISNEFTRWALPVTAAWCLAESIHSDADIESATRVMVWTALGVAAYSALQGLTLLGYENFVPAPVAAITHAGRQDIAFAFYRIYGTFPNLGPIQLGFFLLVPGALAFSRAAGTNGRQRLGWSMAALIISAVIVVTHSRGVQLGFASGLIALALWRRSSLGLGVVVLGLGVAGFLLASTPIGQGFTRIYASGLWDPDIEGRFGEWRAIFSQLADHPFGRGFDSWARASQHIVGITDPFLSDIGAGRAADNQWMLELAERGLPGVLVLALMMGGLLVTTFRKATQVRGSQRDIIVGCGAAFAGWSIAFLSGDSLMYDSIAGSFWYAVALTLAIGRNDLRPAGPSYGTPSDTRAT
jgi:hypothetical protein